MAPSDARRGRARTGASNTRVQVFPPSSLRKMPEAVPRAVPTRYVLESRTSGKLVSPADSGNRRPMSFQLLPASTERSEEHTSELQSPCNLVCRLLLEKKKKEIKCQEVEKAHCT